MTSKAAQIRELLAQGKTTREIVRAIKDATSSYVADVRANPPSGKSKTGIRWTERERGLAAMMRDRDGETYRRIGEVLGRSEQSVMNYFDRRRAKKEGQRQRARQHFSPTEELASLRLDDAAETLFADRITRAGRDYAGRPVAERMAA